MKKSALLLLSLCLMACNQSGQNPTQGDAASATASATTSRNTPPAPMPTLQGESWAELVQYAVDLKNHAETSLVNMTPAQADDFYKQYSKAVLELLTKINAADEAMLQDFSSYFDYNEQTEQATPKPELFAKQKQLELAGLIYVDTGEGMGEINITPDYYQKLFAKYLSPAYQEYINIYAKHDEEQVVLDGGLAISHADLGKRIADWEHYLKQYPDSTLQTEAYCQLSVYQDIFLLGLDNTPIFDYDTNKLEPEVAAAWRGFVEKYPDSPTTELVKQAQQSQNKDKIFAMMEQLRRKQAQKPECSLYW